MKLRVRAAIFSAVTLLMCLVTLTAATYAWFSSNRTVTTSRVEARTGSAQVRLLLSQTGGEQFSGAGEVGLVQVNSADVEALMPVSTADLNTFLYNPATVESFAVTFERVEGEAYYYHGRVYLMAQAEGQSADARFALYLDSGSSIGGFPVRGDGQDPDSLLLNAARLGLTFQNGAAGSTIFSLSRQSSPAGDQVRNTMLNGTLLEDGRVLTLRGGVITSVQDPAVWIGDYCVDTGAAGQTLPAQPLLLMELNRVYQADVYFYLEGCDPDCSGSISYSGVNLNLAFFGVLQ